MGHGIPQPWEPRTEQAPVIWHPPQADLPRGTSNAVALAPFPNEPLLPGSLEEWTGPHSLKALLYFTPRQPQTHDGWRLILGGTLPAQRHYWSAEKKLWCVKRRVEL